MEHKIQLSLLDYAADASNVIYSSPKLLQQWTNGFEADPRPVRGRTSGDDVFAFGTLLFEIFSGRLPMAGESDVIVANRIRCGALPNQLRQLDCTDKLKRLIHRCWNHVEELRPRILHLVQHFQPGSCLLRRHSTSEPRLDQMAKSTI
jgi:hypothetical protein